MLGENDSVDRSIDLQDSIHRNVF